MNAAGRSPPMVTATRLSSSICREIQTTQGTGEVARNKLLHHDVCQVEEIIRAAVNARKALTILSQVESYNERIRAGRQIIWQELCVTRADGKVSVQLTDGGYANRDPDWSGPKKKE